MMKRLNCGERLRLLQQQKEISSIDLAKRMETTAQQIARWRQSSNLKAHTILDICKALEVPVSTFFDA